jgi:chemotaxis protein CheD
MEDSKIYFLQPGYIFASQEAHLIHVILGSCVAVCLWDSKQKIGGACHYIYAGSSNGETNGKNGEVAIKHLIRLMQELGSATNQLKAHIIGGGHNFNSYSSIGNENISIAETILEKYRIRVVSKDVGGTMGRKVIFNSMTGKILVYQTSDIRQTDWY